MVVAPPSPPSLCQFPPSSQPRKLCCPDGFSILSVTRCVSVRVCMCGSRSIATRLSCFCVFVRRCAIGYVVCERSQMGLESFYLAVKTAIFLRGAPPRTRHTPLCGWGPPPDPRVRSQRPQNLELGYRQKSPLPVRPRKKGRFIKAPRATRPCACASSWRASSPMRSAGETAPLVEVVRRVVGQLPRRCVARVDQYLRRRGG